MAGRQSRGRLALGRWQDATGTRVTLRPMRSEPQPPVTEALPSNAPPIGLSYLSRYPPSQSPPGEGTTGEAFDQAEPPGRM